MSGWAFGALCWFYALSVRSPHAYIPLWQTAPKAIMRNVKDGKTRAEHSANLNFVWYVWYFENVKTKPLLSSIDWSVFGRFICHCVRVLIEICCSDFGYIILYWIHQKWISERYLPVTLSKHQNIGVFNRSSNEIQFVSKRLVAVTSLLTP